MATNFADFTEDEERQMQEMEAADHAEPPEQEVEVEEEEVVSRETVEEDPPEEKVEEKEERQTTVPYGALREERDKRQRLEGELSSTKAQMARMEETLQKILTRETPKEQPPDFENDPDAYNAWQLREINKRLENTEKTTKQQQEQTQKQRQAQEFLNAYGRAVEDYAKERPDLKDAYDHLYKTREQQLEISGYTDPMERRRILEYEEEQLVKRAFQSHENPGARIYQLAQSFGYKPRQSDADKVEQLEKGQKATRTLSNVRGSGEPPVTLQRLAELDGDDFDREWEKARKKGLLG